MTNMTKTPEEMAEEYERFNWCVNGLKSAFLAGYQAGRLNSEGVQAAKDQFADASKVIPQWISVKERLPEIEQSSFAMRKESACVLIASNGKVHVAHLCEKWCDRTQLIFEACDCDCRGHDMEQDEWELNQVTHWMPIPEAPKEKND